MPMITCKICGKPTHYIAAHLITGVCTAKDLTLKDYMKRFPDEPIVSESWKEKMTDKTKTLRGN